MLFWRGWGISVFYSFLFWLLASLVLVVASDVYQPDKLKAALEIQWGLAGVLALTAASVFLLARYRKSHPRFVHDEATQSAEAIPHIDDFMFIRFDLWPYILLIPTAFVAAATLLGYPIFGLDG